MSQGLGESGSAVHSAKIVALCSGHFLVFRWSQDVQKVTFSSQILDWPESQRFPDPGRFLRCLTRRLLSPQTMTSASTSPSAPSSPTASTREVPTRASVAKGTTAMARAAKVRVQHACQSCDHPYFCSANW